MHAHRVHATRRLKEAHRGINIDKPVREPCPECGIQTGRSCAVCDGRGGVLRDADAPPDRLEPEVGKCVGEFLAAWAAVRRYGLEAFIRTMPPGTDGSPAEVDPLFTESLMVMDAEMDRLEFEQDVAEALEEAKARR